MIFITVFLKNGYFLKKLYEGKSVVAERFIRPLRNNTYKHMTEVSKKFYFDMLDGCWWIQ